MIKCDDFKREAGYFTAKQILKIGNRPTAIFATSGDMALGAWEAILECELKMSHDIALVGFDDVSLASFKRINLSTVRQRKCEMGIKAVRMLIERITRKGEKVSGQIVLQPKFVIRKSCGCNVD